ncbi:hypothetical protein SAMN04489743_2835 [Pseudarthrobacter equi]|uniref:Uncharacterized protein n=1 Tax=Pseudarthrobacter equi TaxID=728066 RepID=A0A1H2A814_9MICC|nr:hypothetical protein SAMN04489743_2835 [Pseudarthrobacter equi]
MLTIIPAATAKNTGCDCPEDAERSRVLHKADGSIVEGFVPSRTNSRLS